MAYTIENNYTGNNTTTLYSFTFPYLDTSDIKVSLNQIDQTLTTHYTLASPTQISFVTAPGNGVAIRIYRDTNIDNLQSEFFSGSAVRAQDLNNDFNQTLYVSQETQDKVTGMWNDTTETLDSTEAFIDSDSYIMTAKAIDDRINTNIGVQALTDGKILAGNSSNVAAQVTPSGDVTMSNTGAFTIANTAVEKDMIAGDAIDGSKIADDAVDSEHIIDGAVDLAHLSGNSVDSSKIVDGSIVNDDINASAAIAQSKLDLDADLTALSSCQTGAAAKLALLTADEVERIDDLTASTAELNKLDGVTASTADLNIVASMGKETTITNDDTKYPTSGAVVDYVGSQISGINGVELIADDESFPEALPTAGTVVSISDAGGLSINSSGVSTNGDTITSNATVTINGFPSELRGGVGGNADPYVLAAGTGLLLKSTGSSQTYDYHQVMIREADFVQLSDDINDFNSRYRIASSAPGSANDEGDLYFDTSSNKMFVYDGSSWGEVTSTGDFKYLVLCNAGTTNTATYNGSDVSFDLKENSTSGSAASVTNAAQLMVSVNGVIQKPNTGTNTSGLDGFVMTDADTIKFTAGPPANAEVFVIQSGSALSINVCGDGTVTEAKLNANAPTNDYVLTADSTAAGGFKWAATAPASPTTTRGDIIYRGASADQRLPKGTDGQFLKIGSDDPVWADVVGAVADGCIYENSQTISNNHTIASGKGAHSVGPITVNATVTVNGNWVIS